MTGLDQTERRVLESLAAFTVGRAALTIAEAEFGHATAVYVDGVLHDLWQRGLVDVDDNTAPRRMWLITATGREAVTS